MICKETHKSGFFLKMSKGFREQGRVLKMKQYLYKLKKRPRSFFQNLQDNLRKARFISSPINECVFVSEKVI